MQRLRKSLKKPRTRAFQSQNGYCYYCNFPMWKDDINAYALKNAMSLRQARFFESTGEHLIPFSEGGTSKQENIVAACRLCNERRHRRNANLTSAQYIEYVQRHVARGGWNTHLLARSYA